MIKGIQNFNVFLPSKTCWFSKDSSQFYIYCFVNHSRLNFSSQVGALCKKQNQIGIQINEPIHHHRVNSHRLKDSPPPLSNPLELDIVSLVLVSSISEFCVTTGADLDRSRCRLRRVLASFEGFGRLFFYVCFVNFFAFLSLLKLCLETKLVSLSSWGVILQILS